MQVRTLLFALTFAACGTPSTVPIPVTSDFALVEISLLG